MAFYDNPTHACETCGRNMNLVMFETEARTSAIVECPICGEREVITELTPTGKMS